MRKGGEGEGREIRMLTRARETSFRRWCGDRPSPCLHSPDRLSAARLRERRRSSSWTTKVSYPGYIFLTNSRCGWKKSWCTNEWMNLPCVKNIAKILHFLLQKADSSRGVFDGDFERSGQGSGHRLQGVHRQIQLVVQDRVAGSRCRILQIGDRWNEGTRQVQRGNYFNHYAQLYKPYSLMTSYIYLNHGQRKR